MRTPLLATLLLLAACSPAPPAKAPPPPPPATDPKIVATAVSPDSLRVDKIGMRDGALDPDGAVDLVFTVDVEGPLDAFFLVSVDEKGALSGQFRANTLIGAEEAPEELGGSLELGKLSVGIGVMENGKFLNTKTGAIPTLEGKHSLTLYVPNTGKLKEGMRLQLLGRGPKGRVVKGPIISY